MHCPHAARCPGCPAIGLPLAAQHAGKAERLARALAPYPVLAALRPEALRPAASALAYRMRAKLAVAPGPRLGLYARGTHDVVDIPECRVLAPPVAEAAAALRRLLAAPPPGAGTVLRAAGEAAGALHAVDLREVRDEEEGAGVLATLVLRAPPRPDPAALEAAADALASALPALRGVAVRLHDGRSPQLLGGPPRVLRGPARHRDRLRPGAPWVLVSHGSFAQAHREQAAAIHGEVARALGPLAGRRVLELYAGSGALGLALAAAGARGALVESFAGAAEAAAEAARAQGLEVDARPGAVEAWLPRLRAEGARFDAAVANPPRRGIPPRAREELSRICDGPLVYVSCEPETLARDLAHLAWLGWRAERAAPFDLMPLTLEVECVALLRRAPPPLPALLHEDAWLLAVDKPPFLPTLPRPDGPPSLLERVRALPGAREAVPLRPLDAGASGVCLFARTPEHAAALQGALVDARAIERHLALVRGVARPRGRVAREPGAAVRYGRLAVASGHALLELRPESGRRAPIRRLLAGVGEPVLGDERHGHAPSNRHLFERFGLDRPFLHCASVELPHPEDGRTLRVAAPLAPDLAVALGRLGLDPGRIDG